MPGYADRLSAAEIRAVADYVRVLSLGGPAAALAVVADSQSGRRFAGLLRLFLEFLQHLYRIARIASRQAQLHQKA